MRVIATLACLAFANPLAYGDASSSDDPEALANSEELATVRSQIAWGATVNPDRVGVTSEGGWDGGPGRATAAVTVEVTLLARTSVFASFSYGGLDANARPAVGVAYQLIDPRAGRTGLRVSVAYKPEGFTEPDGEIETVTVLSHRIGADALRAMIAYGQDGDGHDSDGELGASYVHLASEHVLVGASVRARRAFSTVGVEPSWDAIGGALSGLAFGRTRVELFVGDHTVAFAAVRSGWIGLISLGTEL